MIRYPNGYIIETDPPENAFFVYGELNATGYVAKGFRLDVPNLSNAGWPQKNELYTHLQSYLSRFDASKRLQFRYTKDSNYRKILENTNPTRSVWQMCRSVGNSESRPPPNFDVRWRLMNSGGSI